MRYNNQNRLFNTHSLFDELRVRMSAIQTEALELSAADFTEKGVEELAENIVEKLTLVTPSLNEDEISVKLREATVEKLSEFNRGVVVRVQGLHIDVKIPFSGSLLLLGCKASTYSVSGTPEGSVEDDCIYLQYQTTETDEEKIKGLWRKDIGSIKQNLAWVEADIGGFMNELKVQALKAVNQRKAQAGELSSLMQNLKS